MSVIEILIILVLVAFIITSWVLSNILQDKNEVIKGCKDAINIHSERGDK